MSVVIGFHQRGELEQSVVEHLVADEPFRKAGGHQQKHQIRDKYFYLHFY